MQSGEKVKPMATGKESENAKGNAVEGPLVVDGYTVEDSMLPNLAELSTDLQQMAMVIGLRQVLRLSLNFAGCHVYFPTLKRLRAKLRDERIRADYDAGVGARRLAQRYKISERQIWNILGT